MRIGLFIATTNPFATPELLATVAGVAEEGGFSSVWVGEHAVLVDEYESRYPYADDGKIPLRGETGLLEPFDSLSFLAALTSRVRLGTAVCLLPQRNPVYTAKDASTVDWLSAGRLDLGIGVGWLRDEFDAVAAPFEHRAERCREYIEIMRRLWCDDVSEHQGRFYSLPRCRMYPKPVQQPHPPLYFGGESDAALRRVADLGRGWHGFNLGPDEAAERVGRLEGLLTERGRTLADIDVTVSSYLKPVEPKSLAAYRDAGVDQLVLPAFATDSEQMRALVGGLSEQFVELAGEM
ncbi:MAG TPA: LLM class F420-dependent oxidoreductase [Acidimicrobiales bacterium]|nr:LLM class F420-dependent oxidoreductase [Acidimicrobiales bacterium]